MLTTAITGAIGAALAAVGVEPGPYLAAVWLGVKGVILLGAGGLVYKLLGRKAAPAEPPAGD